jgi:membrane protein YdbS with pleckstrin-like domain
LYGTYPDAADISGLYACHLVLISVLNFALWWMALSAQRDWHLIGGPAATVIIFAFAAIVAFVAPHDARYAWMLAFIAPVVAALVERRGQRRAREPEKS